MVTGGEASQLHVHRPKLITISKEIPFVDPLTCFAKLSDYGRDTGSILFESADFNQDYGKMSIGAIQPALKISGKGERFVIEALTSVGRKILSIVSDQFDFCKDLGKIDAKISGRIDRAASDVDEETRLKKKGHMDVLRAIAFAGEPQETELPCRGGLFGYFGYDFIDSFETLPTIISKAADYEFYYMDTLFVADHRAKKMHLIADALVFGEDDTSLVAANNRIEEMEQKLLDEIPDHRNSGVLGKIETDSKRDDFKQKVHTIKDHIKNGDLLQCVLSRTVRAQISCEALDIYKQLRTLNPSPYMFYINGVHVVLGASPETAIRVNAESRKVTIRPIAGTKPRGIQNGKIDPDLDNRYEVELKLDQKELSEHTMLVDLARNDIAKICDPGRYVEESLIVEKYSHVQHLVSSVTGKLRSGLDALHAYVATMNMGTLTGAPKIGAMKLIREHETDGRGAYGGAVCYLTAAGDFDSGIIIRSATIKDDTAFVRAGAGIVLGSDPDEEFNETERKAQAVLKAIELAHGGKDERYHDR